MDNNISYFILWYARSHIDGLDGVLDPGPLRREHQLVRPERVGHPGLDVVAVPGGHSLGKGIHEEEVRPAMSPGAHGRGLLGDLHLLLTSGGKVVDEEPVAVAAIPAELAQGAADLGLTTHVAREGVHGHRGGGAALELHVHHLKEGEVFVLL